MKTAAEERARLRRLARRGEGRAIEGREIEGRSSAEGRAALEGGDDLLPQLARLLSQQGRQITMLKAKLAALQEVMVLSRAADGACDVDDVAASISSVERRLVPGAATTVFAFAGLATALSMPPREFFGSLAESGANLFFVKDFNQCWYQRGLLGMSTDIGGTVRVLKALVPPSAPRIATVGTSAGGFAAILLGVLMGARRVIAFGPQTVVDHEVFQRFKNDESSWADVSSGEGVHLDLRKLLETVPFDGTIEIHFSREFDKDRLAAERLADFPFVRLVAHPGSAHNIAARLRDAGELGPLLATLST